MCALIQTFWRYHTLCFMPWCLSTITFLDLIIGCMERLKVLLRDEDNLVRVKTTEVLYVLASHSLGRWVIQESVGLFFLCSSLCKLLACDQCLDLMCFLYQLFYIYKLYKYIFSMLNCFRVHGSLTGFNDKDYNIYLGIFILYLEYL